MIWSFHELVLDVYNFSSKLNIEATKVAISEKVTHLRYLVLVYTNLTVSEVWLL